MEIDSEKLELIRLPQESGEWRYHIPNGYTAEIADGFVVIRPAESDDERIRKMLIARVRTAEELNEELREWIIAYLEKQKDSPMPEDTVVFQKGVAEGRRLEREDMEKKRGPIIETYQRSWYTEGYYDGKLKKEPRWIIKTQGICTKYEENPKYGQSLEEEQKPLLPEDKVKHSLYVEGFEAGKEVGRQCEKVFGKQKEDKPVWSEEDERMLSRCIKSVESSKNFAETQTFKEAKDKEKDWLKSLPERFNLQLKQEWSDEDELMRTAVIQTLETLGGRGTTGIQIDWLKSLRPQLKQEWSKEDILYYNAVMEMVMYSLYLPSRPKNEVIKWLKSLKNRGNFPKISSNSPSWKPSEEQMRAFHELLGGKVPRAPELYELYNDLEKLM